MKPLVLVLSFPSSTVQSFRPVGALNTAFYSVSAVFNACVSPYTRIVSAGFLHQINEVFAGYREPWAPTGFVSAHAPRAAEADGRASPPRPEPRVWDFPAPPAPVPTPVEHPERREKRCLLYR